MELEIEWPKFLLLHQFGNHCQTVNFPVRLHFLKPVPMPSGAVTSVNSSKHSLPIVMSFTNRMSHIYEYGKYSFDF